VEAMEASEEYQKIKKPVLTADEQRRQRELAEEIIRDLRRKQPGEVH
jgi:hypothetical protein